MEKDKNLSIEYLKESSDIVSDKADIEGVFSNNKIEEKNKEKVIEAVGIDNVGINFHDESETTDDKKAPKLNDENNEYDESTVNVETVRIEDESAHVKSSENSETESLDWEEKTEIDLTELDDENNSYGNDGAESSIKSDNVIDRLLNKHNAEIVEDELFGNKKYLKFRLSQFEGPLDLLCTLVRENKVEVEDIFISDITGQYLEIVSNSSFDDVEYASEFLIMAATLLEIKSKKLLPVVTADDGEENDADYDERMIIRQIKEYDLFKKTGEKLAEQEALYQFTRKPVYTEDDYRICLVDFNLDRLVDAFAKVISRAEIEAEAIKPKTIIKERFTVSNRIKHIARSIFELKKMNFFDLYDENYSKLEIINTFLAILELLKRQYITAIQENEFSDIYLELSDGVEAPLSLEEGEENEIGY